MLTELLQSKQKVFLFPRLILFSIIFCSALTMIWYHLLHAGMEHYVLSRDLNQIYLMSSAILAGHDPYRAIPELSMEYLGKANFGINPHPSPYGPAIALLLIPFVYLFSIETVHQIWLGASLISLALSIYMILKMVIRLRVSILQFIFLFSCCVVFTSPLNEDLFYGQLNCFFLLASLLVYRYVVFQKDFRAGILLGVTFVLKPLLIFLPLYFVSVKRYRVAICSVIFIPASVLFFYLTIGLNSIGRYFEIARQVSQFWSSAPFNNSLFHLLTRLSSPPAYGFTIVNGERTLAFFPNLHENSLSSSFSLLIGFFLVSYLVCRVFKETLEPVRYYKFVCLSTLALPVSWPHYAVVYLPLLAIALKIFYDSDRVDFRLCVVLVSILIIFLVDIFSVLHSISVMQTSEEAVLPISISFQMASYLFPLCATLFLSIRWSRLS